MQLDVDVSVVVVIVVIRAVPVIEMFRRDCRILGNVCAMGCGVVNLGVVVSRNGDEVQRWGGKREVCGGERM